MYESILIPMVLLLIIVGAVGGLNAWKDKSPTVQDISIGLAIGIFLVGFTDFWCNKIILPKIS